MHFFRIPGGLMLFAIALPVFAAPAYAAPAGAPHLRPPFVVGAQTNTPLIFTPAASGAPPLHFAAKGLPAGITCSKTTGALRGKLHASCTVAISVSNRFGTVTHAYRLQAGSTALTPPMGWNSYDYYGDRVNQAEVMANAQCEAQKLLPYGWNYVVVDYRWYAPHADAYPDNGAPNEPLTMDAWGRLLPAPDRFPSARNGEGFKALAHRLHQMGLRFGIHIMRGIPREAVEKNLPIKGSPYHAADAADTANICPWCPDMYGVKGSTPAGQAYYNSIFRMYAHWGIDFVKMDDTSQPYHQDEIEAVHRAIQQCGRTIVLSLSPGETPLQDAKNVQSHANMWRLSNDFWDNWRSLNYAFTLARRWQAYIGPGHWPDEDMLPLGHLSMGSRPVGPDRYTSFTPNEQQTLLSFWCLLPAPLMAGGNLPDSPQETALLANPEVIALDQDAAGSAATLVQRSPALEIWKRKLANGDVAAGVFNRSNSPVSSSIPLSQLRLNGTWMLRDLWKHKNLEKCDSAFPVSLAPHACLLLRLHAVSRT